MSKLDTHSMGRVKWWRPSDGTGYIVAGNYSFYVDRSCLDGHRDLADGAAVLFIPFLLLGTWLATEVTTRGLLQPVRGPAV